MTKRSFQSIIVMLIFSMSINLYGQTTQKELAEHRKKWDSPSWSDTLRNPYEHNTAQTDSGKVLYSRICSVCHGTSGKGDGIAAPGLSVPPADHTSASVQMQTDGALFWELSNGHAPMPAFKGVLTEKQRWALINYIRALKPKTKGK